MRTGRVKDVSSSFDVRGLDDVYYEASLLLDKYILIGFIDAGGEKMSLADSGRVFDTVRKEVLKFLSKTPLSSRPVSLLNLKNKSNFLEAVGDGVGKSMRKYLIVGDKMQKFIKGGAKITFAFILLYGSNVYFACEQSCEVIIDEGRPSAEDEYEVTLPTEESVKFSYHGGYYQIALAPLEVRTVMKGRVQELVYTYDPTQDYSDKEPPAGFGTEDCYKEMAAKDRVFALKNGIPYYYYSEFPENFNYNCGRLSYDSLEPCDNPGLIPERDLPLLYKGRKRLEVGPAPVYYCKKQLERDNPDYYVQSDNRVLKGSTLVSSGKDKKTYFAEDLCRSQKMKCDKFYDQQDVVFYKKSKVETPFQSKPLFPEVFLREEVSTDSLAAFLRLFEENTEKIYPSVFRLLAKDFNPEICITAVDKNYEKVFYTQPLTNLTRLHIFYIVPNFGESGGHASILLVDFYKKVITPIDSYFASYRDAAALRKIAWKCCSMRIAHENRKPEEDYSLHSRSIISDGNDYEFSLDEIPGGPKILDERFYNRMEIKEIYKCPRETVKKGAQVHSMPRDLSCYIWSLFFVYQVLINYDWIKDDRSFYHSLEKNLNAAVLAMGGPARTIVSFFLYAVETVLNLEPRERERLLITEEEYLEMEKISYHLWSVDKNAYVDYLRNFYAEKDYQGFYDQLKKRANLGRQNDLYAEYYINSNSRVQGADKVRENTTFLPPTERAGLYDKVRENTTFLPPTERAGLYDKVRENIPYSDYGHQGFDKEALLRSISEAPANSYPYQQDLFNKEALLRSITEAPANNYPYQQDLFNKEAILKNMANYSASSEGYNQEFYGSIDVAENPEDYSHLYEE